MRFYVVLFRRKSRPLMELLPPDKLPDKVRKRSIECRECSTIAVFNRKGESKGLYCSKHKADGMIDVRNYKCADPTCTVIPVFNKIGETRGLYCADHKTNDMLNVKDSFCKEEGCKTRPIYNLPDTTTGLYCNDHKKEGMINVITKRCIYPDCIIFLFLILQVNPLDYIAMIIKRMEW